MPGQHSNDPGVPVMDGRHDQLVFCSRGYTRIGSGNDLPSPFIHLWSGLTVEPFVLAQNVPSSRQSRTVSRCIACQAHVMKGVILSWAGHWPNATSVALSRHQPNWWCHSAIRGTNRKGWYGTRFQIIAA